MVRYETLHKEFVLKIHKEIPFKHDESIFQSKDANLDHALYRTENTRGVNRKAAILMRSIATDQIFIDGNKRTAFMAAKLLLELNGKKFDRVHEFTKVAFTKDVADKKIGINKMAQWFANHTRNGGKK